VAPRRLRNIRVAEATLMEQRKVVKIAPNALLWGSAFGSALTVLIDGRRRNFSKKCVYALNV